MGFYRFKRRSNLTCLLILALIQRAFIAPGYMPAFSIGHETAMTITLCNGDGSYAGLIARLQDQKNKSGNNHQQHASVVCSLLTGSTNVLGDVTLFSDGLLQPPVAGKPEVYNFPIVVKFYSITHPSRAPPVPSAV